MVDWGSGEEVDALCYKIGVRKPGSTEVEESEHELKIAACLCTVGAKLDVWIECAFLS